MSKVQLLPDNELIRRAGHAGRNLTALSILATITAICMLTFVSYGGLPEPKLFVLALAFVLLPVVGFWLLSIAARRGNTVPVTIVIAVLFAQFILSIAGFCIGFIRSNGNSGHASLLGAAVAFAIIVALARSRTVLLELKKRGLWEQIFGTARSSTIHCIVGGACIAIVWVGLIVSLFVDAVIAAQNAKIVAEEKQQAHAFICMTQQEEVEFLLSMQSLGQGGGKEAMKHALAKIDALDKKVIDLQSKMPANGTLARIMAKYKQAVQDWKSGLAALDNPTPDMKAAAEKLASGDKLREEAAKEFDQKYINK